MTITVAQMRAARSLLGWTQEELAVASGMASVSIRNIERGAKAARATSLQKIEDALVKAGIVLSGRTGVGMKHDTAR
jgi:transcriptional regulator with XRE-family HTH domain